jgi:hypothetical protein
LLNIRGGEVVGWAEHIANIETRKESDRLSMISILK